MKMYVFQLRFHGSLEAIIWTNDDLVYWRIYALLGLNELTLRHGVISAHMKYGCGNLALTYSRLTPGPLGDLSEN